MEQRKKSSRCKLMLYNRGDDIYIYSHDTDVMYGLFSHRHATASTYLTVRRESFPTAAIILELVGLSGVSHDDNRGSVPISSRKVRADVVLVSGASVKRLCHTKWDCTRIKGAIL